MPRRKLLGDDVGVLHNLPNYVTEALEMAQRPAVIVGGAGLAAGALDALLVSRKNGGLRSDTPHLKLPYQSTWNWQQPAPPPPNRPLTDQ